MRTLSAEAASTTWSRRTRATGRSCTLSPFVSVITNVEADHLDHYDSLEQIESTFADFMERTVEDGTLVVCGDDARLVEIAASSGHRVVTYGFDERCDVRCVAGDRAGLGRAFTVHLPSGETVECQTSVPGLHMVSNATAAMALAYVLGLNAEEASRALATFTGVRRRFDLVGEVDGITVVDDYAHHPTEVRATLEAARGLGFERIWALFQPHRYSRTQAFSGEFGAAFDDADRLVLMDVYSAGEAPIPGVGGRTLLETALRHRPRTRAAYLPHRADIVPYLVERVREGDLVMTMGAGDVTTLGPEIVSALESRDSGWVLAVPVAAVYERLHAELVGVVKRDEPMARHTTFRIGGPAALYVECANLADLTLDRRILRSRGA